MSINVVQDLDLGGRSKLIGALIDPRSTPPSSPGQGQVYFSTTSGLLEYFDGLGWVAPGAGSISTVVGTSPINVALSGATATVSIDAAWAGGPGTMAASHYTMLVNAGSASVFNTLVKRDGSGNFSANLITASLSGTASNASQLNGQAATYYTNRTNHTGTQLSSTISDLATTVQGYTLNLFALPTLPLNLNSQRIINLAAPTAGTDGATKAYVDASRLALTVKNPAATASTTNINIAAPGGTIGGWLLSVSDRILLKDQTDATQNGVYQWNGPSVPLTRTLDANTSDLMTSGLFIYIQNGTFAGNQYVLSTPNPITLGTTTLAFTLFSSINTITTGNGIDKVGTVFTADIDNVTLDFTGTSIEVKNAGITTTKVADAAITSAKLGDGSIDLTGTKVSGTLSISRGGTNATSASVARANLGAVGKFAQVIGDGISGTFVVTHSLNTTDVIVGVRENGGTNRQVDAEIQISSANAVSIIFASNPGVNAYKVTVIG